MTATEKATPRPLDALKEIRDLAAAADDYSGGGRLSFEEVCIGAVKDIRETAELALAALPVPAGVVEALGQYDRALAALVRAKLAIECRYNAKYAVAAIDAALAEAASRPAVEAEAGKTTFGPQFFVDVGRDPAKWVAAMRVRLGTDAPSDQVLQDFFAAALSPSPSTAGDEVQRMVERLNTRAGEKTGHSNAALTVAYYDQFDAGLDREAAALLVQLFEQIAALTAERDTAIEQRRVADSNGEYVRDHWYRQFEKAHDRDKASRALLAEAASGLGFYASNWQLNAEGDFSTPGLSRSWMEPNDELLSDEGRRARELVTKLKGAP